MSLSKVRFTAFREEGYPTLYDDQEHKYWLDQNLFCLTSLFLAFYISFLAILLGFRGKRRLYVFIRWSVAFLMAYVMLYCNLMPYWEQSSAQVSVPYKAGSRNLLNASLGLNIGLRGINITLRGIPVQQHNDRFDYNEQFTWTWQQRKPGFGFDAGSLHKQFHRALKQGLPYPILWIAEAFTIDYGLVRIGRYYRQSGWLAHIFMWSAVPLFVLSNLLFQMVIQYGSVFMLFTGLSLLLASVVQVMLRSTVPFAMSVIEMHTQQTLLMQTHYSWCYYLNLINGLTCIVIGVVTMFADLRFPDETANFFGNDVLQSYEDYFAEPSEEDAQSTFTHTETEVKLRRRKGNNQAGSDEGEEAIMRAGLKKKAISNRFSPFQKSTVRRVANQTHMELKHRFQQNDAHKHEQQQHRPAKAMQESKLYENFDVIGEEDIADNEL